MFEKIKLLITRYGSVGFMGLLGSLIYTKIFFSNCRLIRYSIRIRADKSLLLGSMMTTGVDFRLDVFENGSVVFGKGIQINDYVHMAAINHIFIGDNVLIASRVFISDHSHGKFNSTDIEYGPFTPPDQRPLYAKPVHIGNNVWIGESVCVLPGVTIGDGSVIGAGSVVTRDIPPHCVAAGNPAKVIRQWDDATHEWKRV